MKNNTTDALPANMQKLLINMAYSRCLSIAADLGIADLIGDTPKPIEALSNELKMDEDALYRLIKVLASQDTFSIKSDRIISNTEISSCLKSGFPGSQRSFVRMAGSQWLWKAFSNLDYSIESGESAFEKAFTGSKNPFEYFNNTSPEDGEIFNQSMSEFSHFINKPLVDAYDFTGIKSIVDLGGGEGSLLKLIKSNYPETTITLFDLPYVIAQAKALDELSQLNFVGGDFVEKIEPVADCFVIKSVLHNWNDDACMKIIKNCRKSISNDGKMLIMDIVINNDQPQVYEKSLDILMLLLLGSKERTKEEFEVLLEKNNFKLNRVIPTQCPLSIIEASPVHGLV